MFTWNPRDRGSRRGLGARERPTGTGACLPDRVLATAEKVLGSRSHLHARRLVPLWSPRGSSHLSPSSTALSVPEAQRPLYGTPGWAPDCLPQSPGPWAPPSSALLGPDFCPLSNDTHVPVIRLVTPALILQLKNTFRLSKALMCPRHCWAREPDPEESRPSALLVLGTPGEERRPLAQKAESELGEGLRQLPLAVGLCGDRGCAGPLGPCGGDLSTGRGHYPESDTHLWN